MKKLLSGARRQSRGFTLTELMVSLVMGLIVALAAVALARSATGTFHEQARSNTSEMSLRMASNRLRQDLGRASYMSTGNIVLDPKVAKFQTAGNDVTQVSRYSQIARLRGVRIDVNSANTVDGGIPAALVTNSIRPDAIDLAGNFTTDDAYTGVISEGSAGGGCTNPQTISLDTAADAATYTLGGGSGGSVDATQLAANARAAFIPVAGRQFLAQVTDAMGCNHYVPVCAIAVDGAAPKPVLRVMVDAPTAGRAVLYSNAAASDQTPLARNCGSSTGGRVTIAPLSRVRWYIAPTNAALVGDPALEAADRKTDLMRDVLDFNGAVAFSEVVAEYIVDLKFGMVVDDPKGSALTRQHIYDLDSDNGAGEIKRQTYDDDSLVPDGGVGPQHIRTIRYRISARTAVADRDQDLNLDAGAVKARFCVDSNVATCKKGWARVRTLTSEVALTNQTGMFY